MCWFESNLGLTTGNVLVTVVMTGSDVSSSI